MYRRVLRQQNCSSSNNKPGNFKMKKSLIKFNIFWKIWNRINLRQRIQLILNFKKM